MKKLFYLIIVVAFGLSACEKKVETAIDRFTINENVFQEGNSDNIVTVTVTAEGTIGDAITVSYELKESTAKINTDIQAASGQLEFSTDNNTATFDIEIIGDEHFELREYFEVVLNYDFSTTLYFTIMDDDDLQGIEEDDEGFFTPSEYPSMELAWSDEFNGTELSESSWTYELGDGCAKDLCGWGNNELQLYTNEEKNIKVEDGKLTITAVDQFETYTSARIITQDKVEVQYGRIDIRAKMPKGQGMWPALWMLGANINEVSWPRCGEIDIMELVGHEANITHGTVHYDDAGYKYTGGSTGLTEGDLSDKFHVYSIVWDTDKITWYLDNKQYFSFARSQTNNYPFNAPFFFIMNVAVGGNWPGSPDDTTVFPQEMVVDYVRVFQ